MEPIPCEFERSIRKSRHRLRVLLTISSLGEAYVGQLARHTRLPWTRVKWILEGRPPAYRADLSLLGLGLVARVETSHGRKFVITPRGRRKARSVVASWARARGPVRERVDATVQMDGHVSAARGADGRSSAPSPASPVASELDRDLAVYAF